jgi:hypothetical protein
VTRGYLGDANESNRHYIRKGRGSYFFKIATNTLLSLLDEHGAESALYRSQAPVPAYNTTEEDFGEVGELAVDIANPYDYGAAKKPFSTAMLLQGFG